MTRGAGGKKGTRGRVRKNGKVRETEKVRENEKCEMKMAVRLVSATPQIDKRTFMVYYDDEENGSRRGRQRRQTAPVDYSRPAKSVEQALQTLMASCARSERCISDVRHSLYRWRMEAADCETIIARLVKERFVDERRYAAAYVREKMSCSGWGRRRIEMGLRAKGIPQEYIDEALAQIEPRQQTDKLEAMLYRRLVRERDKAKNFYDLQMRLTRWAMGRGFEYAEIQDTLQRIMSDTYQPDETLEPW